MRLGLIGAVGAQAERLRTVAEFLLGPCEAQRVIYLGVDGALDTVVSDWALQILGDSVSEQSVWKRAATLCDGATSASIDDFVERERRVQRLRALECLPAETTRCVELLDGNIAILVHDKASLNEEDILPASFLVFGKGNAPLIKQVGQRWFLCPGALDKSGVMLLDDSTQGISLKLYDSSCKLKHSERLTTTSAAKLKITTE